MHGQNIAPNPNGLPPGTGYSPVNSPAVVEQQTQVGNLRGAVRVEWPAYPRASGPVIGRCPAVVAEPLDFRCQVNAGNIQYRITREPPKPKGWKRHEQTHSFSGTRFIAKVPGLYVLEVDMDGFVRRIEIVAVDPHMLGAMQIDDAAKQRVRLRSVVRDERITQASIIDALEANPYDGSKTFARLLGDPTAPFQATNYGAE
jgi:hypothetical protein